MSSVNFELEKCGRTRGGNNQKIKCPSFFQIKKLNLEFEPIGIKGSTSLGLNYCEPKFGPGSPSPSFLLIKKLKFEFEPT